MVATPVIRETFGMTFECPSGYLDTPSIGVPPRSAADAVAAAVREWQVGGARPADFDVPVEVARSAFAAICGVDTSSVAIGGSVSALMGLVAGSVPDGARVLTASGEFTSVTFPFAVQASRGVVIDEVSVALIPQRAPDYDIVAVSAVNVARRDDTRPRPTPGGRAGQPDAGGRGRHAGRRLAAVALGLGGRGGVRRIQVAAVTARRGLDGDPPGLRREAGCHVSELVCRAIPVGNHLRAAVAPGARQPPI